MITERWIFAQGLLMMILPAAFLPQDAGTMAALGDLTIIAMGFVGVALSIRSPKHHPSPSKIKSIPGVKRKVVA